MLVEALAVGVLAHTIYNVDKSLKIDEKAINKYSKAFSRQEEAAQLLKSKEEYVDKRLANVAKKKRAIINDTVPKFVDVYSKIQKVEVSLKSQSTELAFPINENELSKIDSMAMSCKKEFTDKELVCGWFIMGLGTMIRKDSERSLSAASNQLRAANVVYSQAESVAAVYDAIVERADRIAKLLMAMNALFIKAIQETDNVIGKNGLDVRNYDEFDKGVLMTCVNIAGAMSDLIKVPVVDEDGLVSQAAEDMIATGENYLSKMKTLINS